eukprot:1068775-Amphidinium_carterae.1
MGTGESEPLAAAMGSGDTLAQNDATEGTHSAATLVWLLVYACSVAVAGVDSAAGAEETEAGASATEVCSCRACSSRASPAMALRGATGGRRGNVSAASGRRTMETS